MGEKEKEREGKREIEREREREREIERKEQVNECLLHQLYQHLRSSQTDNINDSFVRKEIYGQSYDQEQAWGRLMPPFLWLL